MSNSELLTTELYPLQFEPILRRLIWGDRRLGTVLNKPLGDANDYAESWEISDYREQVSIVRCGALAGVSLRELLRARPRELFGSALGARDQFPLLVKFIDAQEVLSVQVHPDDERAARLAGDSGKTEAWVVVAAEPGSRIYAGLASGVTPESLREAIARGAVEPLLHRFEPRPGDCILIEAGTVHAIGAGVLLTEIQQMSDATFRIDDWNRVGPDGKPRPLHIEEALESIDFARGPVNPLVPESAVTAAGNVRERLARSRYFEIDRYQLERPEAIGEADRFTIILCLGGSAAVDCRAGSYPLRFGETMLLPAVLGTCTIRPEGRATILRCVVPTP